MTFETLQSQYQFNGMPCHNYILKKLKSEQDMFVFEKSFVKTMISHGFKQENIEISLCSLSQKILPDSPIYGKSFNLSGKGLYRDNSICSFRSDNTTSRYSSCYSYYHSFDKYCTVCQICPYSSVFKNNRIKEELELLRFAFGSIENLEYLKKQKLNATCFRAVYDIMQSHIAATHPKLFPLYKILYKLLNKSTDRYYRSESAGHSFDYKLRIKLTDELSALNLPAACCSEIWFEKQLLIFEEHIFSKPALSKDEISDFLNSVLAKEKYIPPKANLFRTDDSTSKNEIYKGSSSVCNNRPDFTTENTKRTSKSSLNSKYTINIENQNFSHTKTSFPKSDIDKNLIFIPYVTENELFGCAVSLTTQNPLLLSKFETAILSAKRMAIEVVHSDTNKTYFLIWVPRIHAFFYSELTGYTFNEVLLPMFADKDIIKITYSPYWLYSILHNCSNKYIKSIKSIQSMHYLLEIEGFDYITVFTMHGIIPDAAREKFESQTIISSPVFLLMPSYVLCYRKLLRLLKNKGIEKQYSMCSRFIEAISISYDMSFWINTNTFLFTMPKPFSYKFNTVDIRKLQRDGYIVSYTVEFLNELPHSFFANILLLLADTGRLKHLEMNLILYDENQLVLFLSEACFSYALEILSRTIFDYVSGKEEYGILLDYKYVHVLRHVPLTDNTLSDTDVTSVTPSLEAESFYHNEEKVLIPHS